MSREKGVDSSIIIAAVEDAVLTLIDVTDRIIIISIGNIFLVEFAAHIW